MSSPKSKSKPQVKAQAINVILPVELQKKVIIRYGIDAGVKLLKRAKLDKTKDILAAERRVSQQIKLIIDKVLKGELDRSTAIKKLNELRAELNKLKDEYAKLAAPFNNKIRPLRNSLKALDEEITSAIKGLGLLTIYTDPTSLPPEARSASPQVSPTPNK